MPTESETLLIKQYNPQKVCVKKSWSYTDFIGGLDVETNFCFLSNHIYFLFLFWVVVEFFHPCNFFGFPPVLGFLLGEAISFAFVDCQSISIAKVATEDGSGFGGDCRGSR